MIPEEKKLKDLCSRIPYGTKVCVPKLSDGVYELVGVRESEPGMYVAELRLSPKSMVAIPINMVKPYLFPLSSITKKQLQDLGIERDKDILLLSKGLKRIGEGDKSLKGRLIIHHAIGWCIKNHVDYLGLIGDGEAIDATNLINIY